MGKEMKSERKMRYEIGGRGGRGDFAISEQHAPAQLQIRNHTLLRGEVPFQVHRIEPRTIGVLRRLSHIVDGKQIGGPLKVSAQEAAAHVVCEHLADPDSRIKNASVLGATWHAEAAAKPHSKIPWLVAQGLRASLA